MARRCIGPASVHRQSRCAEARIETAVKNFCAVIFLNSLALSTSGQTQADSLDKLATDFWAWRAKYAPFTGDDVNRIEAAGRRSRLVASSDRQSTKRSLPEFEARWKKLDATGWPIPKRVDYRLIGSALSRGRWELDVNPRWKRDPNFYIAQTLTPVVEALTVPGPYNAARSREILTRIENIPSILQQGVANLEKAAGAICHGGNSSVGKYSSASASKWRTALLRSTTLNEQELSDATYRAADALEKFRQWLQEKLPSLPKETALGRDAYLLFSRTSH